MESGEICSTCGIKLNIIQIIKKEDCIDCVICPDCKKILMYKKKEN